MVVMIRNRVGGDFCEDAFGRDGHGHASESKETLYFNWLKKHFFEKKHEILNSASFLTP
jgi:hypothetical protein